MIRVVVKTNSNLKKIAEATKERKKYQSILHEVAQELVLTVKSNTPVKSKSYSSGRKKGISRYRQKAGNLKESIGAFDSDSQKYVRVWVGARVKDGYDGWYAGIVHNGHKVYNNVNSVKRNPLKRWRNKRIAEKTTGYVKAIPFISNAYQAKRSGLESNLKSKIGTDLETLIKQNSNA